MSRCRRSCFYRHASDLSRQRDIFRKPAAMAERRSGAVFQEDVHVIEHATLSAIEAADKQSCPIVRGRGHKMCRPHRGPPPWSIGVNQGRRRSPRSIDCSFALCCLAAFLSCPLGMPLPLAAPLPASASRPRLPPPDGLPEPSSGGFARRIAAERRLAASNARIGAATSEYYPKFSLSGLLGTASYQRLGLALRFSMTYRVEGQASPPIKFLYGCSGSRFTPSSETARTDSARSRPCCAEPWSLGLSMSISG